MDDMEKCDGKATHMDWHPASWYLDTRTHPQQLSEGTRGWSLLLAPWPGAEGSCWECLLLHNSEQASMPPRKQITFIKPREQPTQQPRAAADLPSIAQDWQLMVDLGKQLKFTVHIGATSLWPDIFVLLEVSKQLFLIALMVLWEDHIVEAFQRKIAKYHGVLEECWRQGWWSHCYPIEVGCRGFTGHSLYRAYTLLGMSGPLRRTAIQTAREAAERDSWWLWIKMGDPWPNTAGMQVKVWSTPVGLPGWRCLML